MSVGGKQIVILTIVVLAISSGMSIDARVENPRIQVEQGVPPEEVTCNTGLELIIRTSGKPACVTLDTAERMKDAGLAVILMRPDVPEKDTVFSPVQPEKDTVFSPVQPEKDTVFSPVQPEKDTVFSPVQPEQVGRSDVKIESVPASGGSVVNIYVTDQDLNLAHRGVEIVDTDGLLEFSINGVVIPGPETMIETGPNTGQFYVKLELPDSIDGMQISQDDVILVRYLDGSDASGEQRISSESIKLSNAFASVQVSGGGSRIGHEFTVRIYEPDANRDSRDVDRIPLNELEFRGEGGIRTTLANPKFDANSAFLLETGPNTDTFEVKIKIPRELDGKTIHIGDRYEIRYIDRSTPSNTDEKIVFNGRIG